MHKEQSPPPPTYDESTHGASSSSHAPAGSAVSGPMIRGPDIDYLKTPSGIAKIVEIVACLIGFIIHATTLGYAGGGLVWFATISGFINAVIWFILHLVHAIPQILANYYIELIGCIIFLVFLFISFIVTAVNAWIDAAIGAVCFFCLVAMIAFGVDVFLQVRDIRRKFRERQPRNSRDVPVID